MQSNPVVSRDSLPPGHELSSPAPASAPIAVASSLSNQSFASHAVSPKKIAEYLADSAEALTAGVLGKFDMWRLTVSRVAAIFESTVYSKETWEKLELEKLAGKILESKDAEDDDSDPSERGPIIPKNRIIEGLSLVRSMRQLPADQEIIQLRQDAIRELHDNPRLSKHLESILSPESTRALVMAMTGPNFGFDQYMPSSVRDWYNDNRLEIRTLCGHIDALAAPQSPLLKALVSDLKDFTKTETARLHTEGIRLTPNGAQPAGDPRGGLFNFLYRPLAIHPLRALPFYGPPLGMVSGLMINLFANGDAVLVGQRLMIASLLMVPLSIAYAAAGGAGTKNLICDELKSKAALDVPRALAAAGLIREFIALNRFADATSHPTAFPRIIGGEDAFFIAKEMGSPLRPEHPAYVYNDADISGPDPIVSMGPNSGGKTSWVKDILPNWMLGQLGARALINEGTLSPAKNFVYSVPKQNDSASEHGRFGEEFGWLRPALDSGVDAKTVFVFDEMGSGTAESAAAPISAELIGTFRELELRVILLTHNLSLKKAIADAGIPVRAYHPEIVRMTMPDGSEEADSTHRMLPGFPPDNVPSELGARRVMSKLGLSRQDQLEIVARHKARKTRPPPA